MMRAVPYFLAVTIVILFLGACKKLNPAVNSTSIVGKWNIVSDSTYQGVGSSNHPVNYQGRQGDYFDIRSDTRVYTKEGVVLDTLSYKFLSDTLMIISSFGATLNGAPDTSRILNFTAHSLSIKAKTIFTPGGIFGRKIILSR